MKTILEQIADYQSFVNMPSGHDQIDIKDGMRREQVQKLYTKRYLDGTVVRVMRWETIKESQL